MLLISFYFDRCIYIIDVHVVMKRRERDVMCTSMYIEEQRNGAEEMKSKLVSRSLISSSSSFFLTIYVRYHIH